MEIAGVVFWWYSTHDISEITDKLCEVETGTFASGS